MPMLAFLFLLQILNYNLQGLVCVKLLGHYNWQGPVLPQAIRGLQCRSSCLASSYCAITICIGELQFAAPVLRHVAILVHHTVYLKHALSFGDQGSSRILNTQPHHTRSPNLAIQVKYLKPASSLDNSDSAHLLHPPPTFHGPHACGPRPERRTAEKERGGGWGPAGPGDQRTSLPLGQPYQEPQTGAKPSKKKPTP